MKRIRSACLIQTVCFAMKDDLPREEAARLARREYDHYRSSLDRNGTRYRIIREQTMEDGSGWKYVETIWVGPSQFGSNLMNLTMGCLNLSEGDSAYLDDLQVTAYDEETGRSTVIYSEDFSRDSGWTSFNNSGGQSQYAYVPQDGHNGSGCLMITGRSYYNVLQEGQPDYIAVQEDIPIPILFQALSESIWGC